MVHNLVGRIDENGGVEDDGVSWGGTGAFICKTTSVKCANTLESLEAVCVIQKHYQVHLPICLPYTSRNDSTEDIDTEATYFISDMESVYCQVME